MRKENYIYRKLLKTFSAKAIILLMALLPNKTMAQFPAPALALTNVPEAGNYNLVYTLDVPNEANWDFHSQVPYSVNNAAALTGTPFTRVAYMMDLGTKWVWVSFNQITQNLNEIGIPADYVKQQAVSNMNVFSSSGSGVTNGTGIATGNVEFWSYGYGTGGGNLSIPQGDNNLFDFNDVLATDNDNFGSFQIHNYGLAQTLFAFNRWSWPFGGGDIGIGNRVGGEPDWTFSGTTTNYTIKKIYILIGNACPAPAITCAAPVTINTTPGLCTGTTTLNPPTVSNNCPGTPTLTNNAPSFYPIGNTTVTWTATDAYNNTATCTQVVTVIDNQAPNAVCQNATFILGPSGTISFESQVVQYNPIGYSPTNIPLVPVGVLAGVTASNLSQVGSPFVTNNTNVWPVGNNLSSVTVPTEQYLTFSVNFSTLTNLSRLVYTKFSYFGNGPKWASIRTGADGFASNLSTLSVNPAGQQLLNFDLSALPPVTGSITFRIYFYGATSNGDWADLVSTNQPNGTGLVLYSNSLPLLINGGSNDNCGPVSLSATPSTFTCANAGQNNVVLTVKDKYGNTSACTSVVTIVDNIPPVTPTLANYTGQCSPPATAPTTTDNCAGTVTGTTTTVFPIITPGTTVVTWTFDDGNGNSTTANQNVTINPLTIPVISGTLCAGSTLTVSPTNGIASLTWSLNGTPVSTVDSVSTVAGGNGQGVNANQLNIPYSVYVDGSANVYVADLNNHRIQRWPPGATTGTTVAGGNGPGSGANQLNQPRGVYVDGSGNVYVADRGNHRIQRWAPGATTGTTVAGGNGTGSGANQLTLPNGVYIDGSGNLYVADRSNNRIQRWAPGATSGITVAGGNGTGVNANQLNQPSGVYVDGSDNVFVADQINHRIQRWAPGATSGTTVAGGNGQGVNVNQLNSPVGVYLDGSGNVYVGDLLNQRVQLWAPGATMGTTVAGGNGSGPGGNQIAGASGVYVDGSANVYVADQINNRIQLFTNSFNDSLPNAVVGTYTVTVRGFTGCSVSSATVTVGDNQPPATPTLADVNVGACSGTPVAPTTTDVCAGTITGTTTTVFPITTQGTTVVTWTFNDGNGNSTTANQNVIVDDVTAPALTGDLPLGGTGINACTAQAGPSEAAIAALYSDCSAISVTKTGTPTGDNCSWTVTYHYVIKDAHNNEATPVDITYSGGDDTDPVFTVFPSNMSVGSCREVLYTVVATDNCSTPTLSYVLSGATTESGTGTGEGSVLNEGVTTVTITATDACNNSKQSSFTITVVDLVPPVIDVLDISRSFSADNYGCSIDLGASATDNCHLVSLTSNAPACFPTGSTVVTWTALDQHGNSSTKTQTVTRVPSTIDFSICAGVTRTIYTGTVSGQGPLGPQSINLTTVVAGGLSPYTYNWSPAAGLNNTTIPNPVASPTVTTTYTLTVTDALNNSIYASITINVLPLSAAVFSGNGNNLKFKLCHKPPGNPSNPQNINVSVNALNAHLTSGSSGHNNCYLGPCATNCVNTSQGNYNGRGVNVNVPREAATADKFTVNVSPNPTNNEFLIRVFSKSKKPITVRLLDNNGALLGIHSPAFRTNYVVVGKNLIAGFYFAEVSQGSDKKVVKLIKLN